MTQTSVQHRLAAALKDAGEQFGEAKVLPRGFYLVQAQTSRAFLGALIQTYARNFVAVCGKRNHRGFQIGRNGLPDKPCPNCGKKVETLREAARLIAPDED